jgi:hypothetical protein
MYLSTIKYEKEVIEMSKDKNTKCTVVLLPVDLVRKLNVFKEKTGKSKNSILVQFIEIGLNQKHQTMEE